MAKVPLVPIGRPIDAFLDAKELHHNRTTRAERDERLRERRAAVQAGWGEKYVERVHQKKKLTTRQCPSIRFHLDPGIKIGIETLRKLDEVIGEAKEKDSDPAAQDDSATPATDETNTTGDSGVGS